MRSNRKLIRRIVWGICFLLCFSMFIRGYRRDAAAGSPKRVSHVRTSAHKSSFHSYNISHGSALRLIHEDLLSLTTDLRHTLGEAEVSMMCSNRKSTRELVARCETFFGNPKRKLQTAAFRVMQSSSFMQNSVNDAALRAKIDAQGKKMLRLAHDELGWTEPAVYCGMQEMSLSSILQDTNTITLGIHIATADIIMSALPQDRSLMQRMLLRLLKAASLTYIVLGDRSNMSNEGDFVFLDFISDLPCDLSTIAGTATDPKRGVDVIRVHCEGVSQSAPLRCPESRHSRDCSSVQRSEINSVMKFGTKTAIYDGRLESWRVAWKHFSVAQFMQFEGFHALMNHSLRCPLLNYPLFSCTEGSHHQFIFQPQRFVEHAITLRKFVKHAVSDGGISWGSRIQIAIQILCIFEHLHSHPLGVFTFDDNHPDQYMIVQNASGISVTLIDLDTVQLSVPSATVSTGGGMENFHTICRCFYCHGRSNCLFINTLEGYKHCGQVKNSDDNARPEKTPGRHCDASSDIWFIAQLLLFIVDGNAPWEGAPLREVLDHLQLGHVPKCNSGDPSYDSIVHDAFKTRPSVSDVLHRMIRLCDQYNCKLTKCPAEYTHLPTETPRIP